MNRIDLMMGSVLFLIFVELCPDFNKLFSNDVNPDIVKEPFREDKVDIALYFMR